jgi:hypothetical protein
MSPNTPDPVQIVSVSKKQRRGEIRNGKTRPSRRVTGLQTRDLESSGPSDSKTRGCNTTFASPGHLGQELGYQGGALASGAAIQLIFWGSVWNDPATSPRPNEVAAAVQTLLNSSYFFGLKQYGVDQGPLGKTLIVTSPEPPAQISSEDITGLLWDMIGDKFPEPDEAGGHNIYVFFLPPHAGLPESFYAAHSNTTHYDFPFKVHRAWYVWIGWASGLDPIMTSLTHEVVEAYTNPENSGWMIPNTDPAVSEIADICAEHTGSIDGVPVTSYFSFADSRQTPDNACIIPGGKSVRIFLQIRGIDATNGIRDHVPPGTCLRQFLES